MSKMIVLVEDKLFPLYDVITNSNFPHRFDALNLEKSIL